MQKVVSVENMRKSDEYAKTSVSGRELMFRAGKAVYESVEWKPPVAVVCGGGNNGGDGYVVASFLRDNDIDCIVYVASEKFSVDGKYYFDICMQKGIKIRFCTETTKFKGCNTIVDCMFGTGFRDVAEGLAATVIQNINASGVFIVSVDINSGLNGDNGIGAVCVKSDITISIGNYKSGHFLNMAKDVIGSKKNCDIGIALNEEPYYLWEKDDVKMCLPDRKNFSHKGNYGYVAIVGGSTEYGGAAKLANIAASALYSGCGVVRLAVPKSIINGILPYVLESTVCPLSDIDGKIAFNAEEVDKLMKGSDAIAFGMGATTANGVQECLEYLLKNYNGKLIIDADGINSLATLDKELLKKSKAKIVITPHIKEFERLSGYRQEEILVNPIAKAIKFAKEYNITLLLKGAATIVTDGEKTYITDRGCAGMATAGSGDVLSGILVGLCGYNENITEAAISASYINGMAGEIAQKKANAVSMVSGDTARSIGEAISLILSE